MSDENWNEKEKRWAKEKRKILIQYLAIILIGVFGLVIGIVAAVVRGCPPALGVVCVTIAK